MNTRADSLFAADQRGQTLCASYKFSILSVAIDSGYTRPSRIRPFTRSIIHHVRSYASSRF